MTPAWPAFEQESYLLCRLHCDTFLRPRPAKGRLNGSHSVARSLSPSLLAPLPAQASAAHPSRGLQSRHWYKCHPPTSMIVSPQYFHGRVNFIIFKTNNYSLFCVCLPMFTLFLQKSACGTLFFNITGFPKYKQIYGKGWGGSLVSLTS